MNRRTLLVRSVVAAVGSVGFSATGWLMGAGALSTSSGGYPCWLSLLLPPPENVE